MQNLEDKASNCKVDILFFAWYNSFHQFKKAVKWFPSAKVIIDSVDVHWIREERLLINNNKYKESHVQANKRKEIEAYKAGD